MQHKIREGVSTLGKPVGTHYEKVTTAEHEVHEQFVVCTIAASNYLAQVYVLAESFLKFNPRSRIFLLLLDEGDVHSIDARFAIIRLQELRIPNTDGLLFKYNILEFSTAVKPLLLELLLKRGFRKVIYLDPDILVTHSFQQVSQILDDHTFALTPHILTGIANDDKKPGEVDILLSGTYNLGFIAIKDSEEARQFLNWWKTRLNDYCAVAFERGMFVDQKWMDLAVGIFPGFYIIRDPGYNVAYWNISSRRIRSEDGHYLVNDRPLRFIHFSGFDPDNVDRISKHQNRYRLDAVPDYRQIFIEYSRLVKEKGYDKQKLEPWKYNYYDNGERIPDLARRIYLENTYLQNRYPTPFSTKTQDSFYSWFNTNHGALSYRGRAFNLPEISRRSREIIKNEGFASLLTQTFEKIAKFEFGITPVEVIPRSPHIHHQDLADVTNRREFGVNLAGYFTGRFGSAASSRAFAEALCIGGVPHVLNKLGHGDLGNVHPELQRVEYSFASINPYPINLIHVNADMAEAFFRDIKYSEGKYNIGIWYWELARFPDKFTSAFNFVNEVWATSNFTVEALSKKSAVPVTKVTYPLFMPEKIPTYADARRRFDLIDDECVFLFVFDFRSIVERKNPMSVVRAFRKAFSENDKALLVLNYINSEANKDAESSLVKAVRGSRVRIIPSHLKPEDYISLLVASDCYASLHRSEGLGIPLAEAMYLGKPVIATGYSGNLDFMNVNNSLLVKFRLIKLARNYGPYERGSVWAEADEDHAAQLMRWVYDHRGNAKELGARASEDVKTYLNPRRSAEEIKNRLELAFNRIET